MGTDTRVIAGDTKRNELCECNYKIQKLDNGMLLGISGERLERQTIIAYSEIFTLDKNGELTKKHVIKEIIPNLLSVLKKENLLIKNDGEAPYVKSVILLAHKGVLYEICSGFAVIKYEGFQILGSAANYAQATMANTKETDDINENI
jgi:ATP-dependent protease HslVU (ClpYQ) peptidase subunit